ncbi:MAG TPA: BamA/TamA family outer membrane protein [Bryobacteraceae bacterium]|nr:BamA/TamA family outer membrane protein [Bryobacteraceae bacterium]
MRPPVLLLVTFVVGVAASAQDAQTGVSSRYEGLIIRAIRFDPPSQPLPPEEIARLLPLQAGSELHAADVRQALQKLYETGRFSDAWIDADARPDGVELRISTELTYFVGSVSVEGAADPPSRAQLLSASKLELGAPFAANEMGQAVENMQERLRANGLYRGSIEYHLYPNPSTEEMSVEFEIDAGPRVRFDGVQAQGKFAGSLDSIVRATRWRRGFGPLQFPGWREATENRVQTGIERVRQTLQRDDRLQASVTLDRLEYHEKTSTVTPTLAIDNGPIIRIRASGASVSAGRLRQLLPVYQERTVDRSLLLEGSRNLTDYFQAQGYFDASVDFTQSAEDAGVQAIDYAIARGNRHKLARIEITGNRFFDDATLRERLTTREAGLLRYRHGRYSQRMRDDDRDAIRDLYRANGFRDVVVSATTIDDYGGIKDAIGLRFEIQEGEAWFVESLDIEGVPEDEAAHLTALVQSMPGQTFSDAAVAADRDTVLGYYSNNGYPAATFDWSQAPGENERRVRLRYVVHPGERQFVRDVLVRGLDATRPQLVNSKLQMRAGDPVSLSQIAETQQKLYDLGIFAKVQAALQNPDGVEEKKYVLFQLDEANKYSLTTAVGAQVARIGGGVTTFDAPAGQTTFSPRVSVGLSRLNLFGEANTAGIQTLLSTIEQRAIASYQIPDFAGYESLTLLFSALFDNSYDIRTFASQREEGSVQLAERLSRTNSVQYRFSFRHSTVSQLRISPELVPLLSQPVRVGQLSMSYIYDRRDNSTDTHRGILNTVDAGISLAAFSSQTDFTRLILRNSTYHPLGREMVLARTLQFGYIQRIGGLADIPLPERLFAGGASSQRAFPDNQAGPRDPETGFPLGGTAMLFHSTELRFPLIGDNLGGVLFHDMGNVYSDISSVSFRFRQRDTADFNYMVHSIGFGIRYRTPVGPLRIDLSFSPDPPRFNGFPGTLQDLINCTSAHSCVATSQIISHFQFHFSLGQTF